MRQIPRNWPHPPIVPFPSWKLQYRKCLPWRLCKGSAVKRTAISVIRTNACCWTCWTPQKIQEQNMFIINNFWEIYGLLFIHWVIQSPFFPFPILLRTVLAPPHFPSFSYLSIGTQSCRKTSGRELLPLLALKAPECKTQTESELSYCNVLSLYGSLFFMLIHATTPCYLMTYLCIHTQESVVQRLKKRPNAYWNIHLLGISLSQHQRT